MARTWLSVTVELCGGRGEDLWPWPGRIFAVGPSHTFPGLGDNWTHRCTIGKVTIDPLGEVGIVPDTPLP